MLSLAWSRRGSGLTALHSVLRACCCPTAGSFANAGFTELTERAHLAKLPSVLLFKCPRAPYRPGCLLPDRSSSTPFHVTRAALYGLHLGAPSNYRHYAARSSAWLCRLLVGRHNGLAAGAV